MDNNKVNIDMWYGNKIEEVTSIDVRFYDNGEYRGNIYIDNKIVGDYTAKDSISLEEAFPQLTFNWD